MTSLGRIEWTLIICYLCFWPCAVADLNCGSCLWGHSLICPNIMEHQFSVEIIKDLQNSVKHMVVECNTLDVDFSLLNGCSFPTVRAVQFKYCPFTNESFVHALRQVKVDIENITVLNIYFPKQEAKTLYPHHFQDLSNLLYFHIDGASLKGISENAFHLVPKLKKLHIKGNDLGPLKNETFRGLSELLELNLSHNNITSIPEGLFDDLKQLSRLHFWTNKIKKLPQNIFDELKNLQTLTLDRNSISSIDENLFKNNTKISTVSFKNNQIEEIPANLFKYCTDLKVIKFTNNKIKYLPDNIFKYNKNLTLIELSKNYIEEIPVSLFKNLTSLDSISLSKNRINSLPGPLFKVNKLLKQIDLKDNLISKLPFGLLNNTINLKSINFENNSLVTLPNDLFLNCLSLEELYLNKNKLAVLHFNSFPKTSVLRVIDLSYNNLTVEGITPDYVFALNTQVDLQVIDLSYNQFTDIPVEAYFYNFGKLRSLNFEGNYIRGLHFTDIFQLANDVTLNFKNNRIERMAGKFIPPKKQINIKLGGNNFTCDCQIFELVKMIQEDDESLSRIAYYLTAPFQKEDHNLDENTNILHVLDKDDIKCQRPTSLANNLLKSVDLFRLTCSLPKNPKTCSSDCPCTYRPFDTMLIVECSKSNFNSIPHVVYHNNTNYTLDLSANTISTFNFSERSSIVELNLSSNNLTFQDLESNSTVLPPKLRFLDLKNNSLTRLGSNFLKQVNHTQTGIDLTDNPWVCDCGIKDLHLFIQTQYSKVRNIQKIMCNVKEGKKVSLPLMDLVKDDFCPLLLQPMVFTTIGVIIVLLVLFAVLVTASFYRYKTRIKVWLFTHRMCLWLVTEDELDVDKQYDAFISYSHKDEEFVNSILVPGLENGEPKYRVCLHYRDWIVGEFIQNQILNSVHNSRRTLIILSTNFIESVWGQMEFRAAHQQALQDKTNRVIVIVYGQMPPEESLDEELLHYIKMHTYLKWGDPRFWESLRYAMPHPKHLLMGRKKKRKNVDKLELVNGHIFTSTTAIRV